MALAKRIVQQRSFASLITSAHSRTRASDPRAVELCMHASRELSIVSLAYLVPRPRAFDNLNPRTQVRRHALGTRHAVAGIAQLFPPCSSFNFALLEHFVV
jgi:hypothetical protein